MKYRLSMFWWKMNCAWCDVKQGFAYLTLGKLPPPLNPPRVITEDELLAALQRDYPR